VVWAKRRLFTSSFSVPELSEWSEYLETEGKTVVWVADTHQVLGVIAVADTVRPEALSMVAKLKN